MSERTGGPDGLTVRAATPGDLDAIAELHTRARARYDQERLTAAPPDDPAGHARRRAEWARSLDRTDTTVLCAERSGAVVGVAAFRYEEGTPARTVLLDQLHVDPDHWRTGVGTALHHACLAAWRSAGMASARLEVYWHNRRARDFYARHGWQPDDQRRPGPDATHLSLVRSVTE